MIAPAASSPTSTTTGVDAFGPTPDGYRLDVDVDPVRRTLTGTEQVVVHNTDATPLDQIYLRLWANAPELAKDGGKAVVRNVTVNGQAARATVDGTVLRIQLLHPLAPGASATVSMSVELTAPATNGRMGVNGAGVTAWGNAIPTLAVHDAHGWHLEPYFAQGESYYTLAADWRMHLHVPAGIQDVETGAEFARSARPDGSSDVDVEAHGVRDPLLVAGSSSQLHQVEARAEDGTRIRLWSADPSGADQRAVLDEARSAFDWYTGHYGSAAIPELDVLDIGIGGMEYSGAVLARSKHEVAHEISHQWFYGAVGNNQYNDSWLDEAFADFVTRDYFEHGPGNRPDTRLLRWAERVAVTGLGPIAQLAGSPSDPVSRFASVGQQGYRLAVYLGGSRVLEQLRSELGAQTFAQGMRAYVARFRGGVATTQGFVDTMSSVAGRNLGDWFERHGVHALDGVLTPFGQRIPAPAVVERR